MSYLDDFPFVVCRTRTERPKPTQNRAGGTAELEKVPPQQEEEEPLVARQPAKK